MSEALTRLDRAERALLDSETRLQQVLDNTSALVFAKDRQGRYLFVNSEFERVVGRSAADVLGRTDEEVFRADLAMRFRHNDLRVLREERAIEFEEVADFGDGDRTFLSSKFPLRDAAREAYAVCGIATDITERKRLEDALSRAALAVSESEGEALFRELAHYLATILRVDAVFISTVDPDDCAQMQVRAMHLDGRTIENFSYALGGTPCETVVGQEFRFYPNRLQELFPKDTDFRDLGFEAYAGHPLTDASGRPLGLLAVVCRRPLENPSFVESVLRIFAARVLAEIQRLASQEALRTSEASYREIFEASEDAIFVHDWDSGAIVDANPQACRAYGYSRDELLQQRPGDLSSGVAPYTEEEALRWIERARRDGHARCEWHRRSRDGSLHWDEVRLKAARIGGKPRILAFTREITEHKAAEEALRASEEQYRAIFDASVDGLMLKDESHRIVDVNEAWLAMHGYRREEMVGRQLAEFIPAELQAQCEVLLPEILCGTPCHLEARSRRRDGTTFDVDIHGVPMQYGGRPHALIIMRDITERKRAEGERQVLEARLRQAQKMEAIGQLTGGIAHDFNNLLTSIMGYVSLAADRDAVLGDRRLSGYLAQAQRSCERARDLIQQMLMFSRGQRGSPKALDLARLVEESLETLKPTLPETIDLTGEIDDGVPLVRADPLQVEQVLLNLCINARDAVGESGRLTVSVRSLVDPEAACSGCRAGVQGSFVEISVADTGHGMTPEVMERIFEPFFSTKETGKGTGMGLAMVHGIVHDHGGHVIVDSEPGRGSRFRVLWPAIPATGAPAPAEPSGSADRRTRGPRPEMRGTALVVDDEVAVGEFMRELLESWGLDATFVPSPQAAVELVAAGPERFDVVITDQSMPRMTGLQLARTLHEVRATLPIVLYTGYGQGIAASDLQVAGIRAVLAKPIDPAALENALSGILGRQRAPHRER